MSMCKLWFLIFVCVRACVYFLIFQLAENYNLFPKAVSVEEKEEASRNSTREHFFVSNKTVLAAGERHPQQPKLQGSLIIQRKAADQWELWLKLLTCL